MRCYLYFNYHIKVSIINRNQFFNFVTIKIPDINSKLNEFYATYTSIRNNSSNSVFQKTIAADLFNHAAAKYLWTEESEGLIDYGIDNSTIDSIYSLNEDFQGLEMFFCNNTNFNKQGLYSISKTIQYLESIPWLLEYATFKDAIFRERSETILHDIVNELNSHQRKKYTELNRFEATKKVYFNRKHSPFKQMLFAKHTPENNFCEAKKSFTYEMAKSSNFLGEKLADKYFKDY